MKFRLFKKAVQLGKWAVRLGKRAGHFGKTFLCSLWRHTKNFARKVKDFLWWLFDFDSLDPLTIIVHMYIHKYIYVILLASLNGQFLIAGIIVIIILIFLYVMRKYRENKCLI